MVFDFMICRTDIEIASVGTLPLSDRTVIVPGDVNAVPVYVGDKRAESTGPELLSVLVTDMPLLGWTWLVARLAPAHVLRDPRQLGRAEVAAGERGEGFRIGAGGDGHRRSLRLH